MTELLSISIPTRNRASYLQQLLKCIEDQTREDERILPLMRVYIFDNASTDDTEKIVKNCGLDILYRRNRHNVGGDRNIYQAYTMVAGQYVWVLGDDELLSKDAIRVILHVINTHGPHLILNNSRSYNPFVDLPLLFTDYAAFARFAELHNPHLLIAHSLISANVLLKICFDSQLALEKIGTYYGHMYGMIGGLSRLPGCIVFPSEETLIVREARATAVDGIWPTTIEEDQIHYLAWVSKKYNLKTVVPRKVVPEYRRRLFWAQPVGSLMLYVLRHIYSKCSVCWPILRIAKSLYKMLRKAVLQGRA